MNTPADGRRAGTPRRSRGSRRCPPNDYPDASYLPLKRAIAAYAGVAPAQIVVGAGAATRCSRSARSSRSGRGDRRSCARPTYQLYAVASRNAGAEVLALEPRDGSRSTGRLLSAAADVRVVWLCSPNNPTGEEPTPARRGALPRLPGHRRGRPGLPRVRRRPTSAARRASTRTSSSRARSRRASRSAPRASATASRSPRSPARSTPCARRARISSWSAARGRARAAASADEMRDALRRVVAERGRLAAGCASAGVEVPAHARQLRARARARARRRSSGCVARGMVVRTFGHEPLLAAYLRITVSHPGRQRRGCCAALADARRRRGRRRRHGVPRRAHRRGAPRDARDAASTARSRSTAAAAPASRPASASSTTCSRRSRSGR